MSNGMSRVAARIALALAPAPLFGIYATWPALAALPYVALVPWVLLYTDERGSRVSMLYFVLGAYLSWVVSYLPLLNFGWYVPWAMGAVLFLPIVVFAPILGEVHRAFRLPRSISVPVVWVAVEWLRATVTTGHFDLYGLGYSQARFPILIQVADVVGVYGVSFLVAAVNGWLADAIHALRERKGPAVEALRSRPVALGAACIAAAFVVVLGYGGLRLGMTPATEGPTLAIVQPNIGHSHATVVGTHLSQIAMTEQRIGRSEADLIVWPENAILDLVENERAYVEDLGWLASSKDALLLVGALGASREHPGHETNAAFLIDREGEILERYDKQVLFPWSEYVPLDGVLARVAPPLYRAHRMVARLGWGSLATGVAGDTTTLFRLPWRGGELPFATLICIENVYPPVPAKAAREGARFFVNITSEGLVGGPVQEQLLRISILRAVENRIPYVRAGNTGISGFIDARGRVRSVLRGDRGGAIDDRGTLVSRVALSGAGPAPYTQSRDAFALATVACTLLLLVGAVARRFRAGTA